MLKVSESLESLKDLQKLLAVFALALSLLELTKPIVVMKATVSESLSVMRKTHQQNGEVQSFIPSCPLC